MPVAEPRKAPIDWRIGTISIRRHRNWNMVQLRATGPYVWVTWLPRLLSGESSCEWASWFKAQHEGWSWSRMSSDFDQSGWLMSHTALLNDQRQRWEQQGHTVLTEGQNSFNLRGSSAVLAGKPDLVARRRDEVTVIDAKTGRLSPAHAIQVLIYMYAMPLALERYRGLSIAGQVAYPDHVVDIPADAVDERFVENLGGIIRSTASRCQPGGSPTRESAGSAISLRPTARTAWMRALRRKARPTTSKKEPRAMETLTLTLHKAKDTKNKVVYGTKDGSVIQSVYIDKDALGENPPAAIQVVLTSQ